MLVEGVKVRTEEGTPQGGPLSPLLANIRLDDLDQELARRGHRFVRYADDCNVYVRSGRAGERVMAGVKEFLARRLKLQVNEEKSAVDRATRRGFLGFDFLGGKAVRIRLDPKSLRRVKAVIRKHTARSRSIAMAMRISELNRYLLGWLAYFALAETPSKFAELDEWLRRRLRLPATATSDVLAMIASITTEVSMSLLRMNSSPLQFATSEWKRVSLRSRTPKSRSTAPRPSALLVTSFEATVGVSSTATNCPSTGCVRPHPPG